jgi:DNA-binding MarR family transcriptional regulator
MSSPRRPSGDADYSIGPLLRLAGRRSSTAFSAELAPLGIEGRHFGVLLQLSRRGPLSQRQLTEFTGSDKSTMVRTIDDLQDRGLVIRQPAVGDRRAYAVDLTDAGRDLFARAEQVAIRVNGKLLAHLDPAERDQLRGLLRKFAQPPSDA